MNDGILFQGLDAKQVPHTPIVDAIDTIQAFVLDDIHQRFGDEEFDTVHL